MPAALTLRTSARTASPCVVEAVAVGPSLPVPVVAVVEPALEDAVVSSELALEADEVGAVAAVGDAVSAREQPVQKDR
ncbi:MAG: hypothetical protein KC486_26665 [Myxococcales bacterium]|nr:hypothetical protein [Myxococcales bacterium]